MKKLICTFALFLLFLTPAYAYEGKYLRDQSGVISFSDGMSLENALEQVSDIHKIDVAVLIVQDADYYSLSDYADDYYDNNYGKDGLALVVVLDKNDRYVTASGSCIDYVNDDFLEDISQAISPHFEEENYAEGIRAFVTEVDGGINAYKAFQVFKLVLISVGIGLAVSLITAKILKEQLNGAKFASGAAVYQKPGSFNVTNSRDIFLYSNITRVRRSSESSSSSHRASSGRSHGGGRV